MALFNVSIYNIYGWQLRDDIISAPTKFQAQKEAELLYPTLKYVSVKKQ